MGVLVPPNHGTHEGTDREPSRFAARSSASRALNRFGRPSAYLAAANRDGSRSGGTGKMRPRKIQTQNPPLQGSALLPPFTRMSKKSLPVLCLSLLLAGCATQLTNLTPQHQVRNADNQYLVEVAFHTRQQTVRWPSIHPQIVVGTEFYDMRPTLLMTNRWEGFIPVPRGTSLIHYHYKFDFQFNKMGNPGTDTSLSPEYTLSIIDQ